MLATRCQHGKEKKMGKKFIYLLIMKGSISIYTWQLTSLEFCHLIYACFHQKTVLDAKKQHHFEKYQFIHLRALGAECFHSTETFKLAASSLEYKAAHLRLIVTISISGRKFTMRKLPHGATMTTQKALLCYLVLISVVRSKGFPAPSLQFSLTWQVKLRLITTSRK